MRRAGLHRLVLQSIGTVHQRRTRGQPDRRGNAADDRHVVSVRCDCDAQRRHQSGRHVAGGVALVEHASGNGHERWIGDGRQQGLRGD